MHMYVHTCIYGAPLHAAVYISPQWAGACLRTGWRAKKLEREYQIVAWGRQRGKSRLLMTRSQNFQWACIERSLQEGPIPTSKENLNSGVQCMLCVMLLERLCKDQLKQEKSLDISSIAGGQYHHACIYTLLVHRFTKYQLPILTRLFTFICTSRREITSTVQAHLWV